MMEASDRFERTLRIRFGRSSTADNYASDVRLFLRTWGDRPLAAVTAVDIDRFVDGQIRAGLAPNTINRRLTGLHAFFEFLAGEHPEGILRNPVIRRRHFLKRERHLPRDASDEDIARLFGAISSKQDKALFGLMVGAGLRVSEVRDLCLADLNLTNPVAEIRVWGKGDYERIIWLTPSLCSALQAWLSERPATEEENIFLSQRGKPITKPGIQYRMRKYCQLAEIRLSCHQLRHTFARRLVENGLPVDSLARLLGHRHLKSTQCYIEGADPALQADFATVMSKLETTLVRDTADHPLPPAAPPSTKPRYARRRDLEKLHERLETLPPWLAEAMQAYLGWRWPTWREQTAYKLGRDAVSLVKRLWTWLEENRQVEGWQSFRRGDFEAWVISRQQGNLSRVTIRNDIAQLQSIFRFLELREYPVNPGIFRVRPPRLRSAPLPRYLSEADYGWLETSVMQATREETYDACFDRAWFLTLAHTGLRLAELMDLRIGDVNLAKGTATVRGSKPGRDRVVYLTPALTQALVRYLHVRPTVDGEDHLFLLHGLLPHTRTIQRRLDKYGKRAGVRVTPHRLRHTFATRLLNAGMPLYALRKLLGHQDLNTTQLYARVYDETLVKQFQEAMARIEAGTE